MYILVVNTDQVVKVAVGLCGYYIICTEFFPIHSLSSTKHIFRYCHSCRPYDMYTGSDSVGGFSRYSRILLLEKTKEVSK